MPDRPDKERVIAVLKGVGALFLSSLPVLLHLGLLLYLPTFHWEVRSAFDHLWRYRIADSGVTVGLAYYSVMAFLLWQSRWVSWKTATWLMDTFDNCIDDAFSTKVAGAARPLPPPVRILLFLALLSVAFGSSCSKRAASGPSDTVVLRDEDRSKLYTDKSLLLSYAGPDRRIDLGEPLPQGLKPSVSAQQFEDAAARIHSIVVDYREKGMPISTGFSNSGLLWIWAKNVPTDKRVELRSKFEPIPGVQNIEVKDHFKTASELYTDVVSSANP